MPLWVDPYGCHRSAVHVHATANVAARGREQFSGLITGSLNGHNLYMSDKSVVHNAQCITFVRLDTDYTRLSSHTLATGNVIYFHPLDFRPCMPWGKWVFRFFFHQTFFHFCVKTRETIHGNFNRPFPFRFFLFFSKQKRWTLFCN